MLQPAPFITGGSQLLELTADRIIEVVLWTRSTATLDRMILHLTSSRGIKSDFISRCTMNYLAHSQLTFRIIQHHAPSKREMRTGSHYSYQDGRGNNS